MEFHTFTTIRSTRLTLAPAAYKESTYLGKTPASVEVSQYGRGAGDKHSRVLSKPAGCVGCDQRRRLPFISKKPKEDRNYHNQQGFLFLFAEESLSALISKSIPNGKRAN